MAGRIVSGRIVSIEPLAGDATLVTVACPSGIASQAKAGQFVGVRCRDHWSFDPYLRRSYFVFSASAADETLSIAVTHRDRGDWWLAEREQGAAIDFSVPSGNGFVIAPTSRNVLLVGSEDRCSSLVMLAVTAVERGLNVTFLNGAPNERGLLPSHLLPSSVEVVVATTDGSRGHAGEITALLPEYARWADQIMMQGVEPS